MKILIIGQGGREHALAWRFSQDKNIKNVYVLPGNPGMEITQKVEIISGTLELGKGFLTLVKGLDPDLIVVGPEAPLCEGMVDYLKEHKFTVLGPSAACARLEGSKAFAKEFMRENEIPTADFEIFDNSKEAQEFVRTRPWHGDLVIKASDLAQGKGVVVSNDLAVQEKAIFDFLDNPECEVKTTQVVIEQCLKGKELSVFALCDGEDFIWLGEARDHKRLGENDTGPNTGGMGCFTHEGMISEELQKRIEEQTIKPVLAGMNKLGTPFCGLLFIGLMIQNENEFTVLEYNVRFGDPEAQTLLPLIKGDFSEAMRLAALGMLGGARGLIWRDFSQACVHVVMTSKNYPSIDGTALLLDEEISYDDALAGMKHPEIQLFFAGVKNKSGKLVNSGGRVLGVSAWASDLEQARTLAYAQLKKIHFNGAYYRGDIALNAKS